MAVPNDRKYRETHEWFKADGNVVTVGVSQFAADELTDVVYVELPEGGALLEADGQLGEIESVKATSDLYTAVGGKVIEVNTRLSDEPELVNNDPFGDGWMVKIECDDLGPLEKLLDGPAYDRQIGY